MCGCCGKRVPKLIWVDNGDGWDDIGICDECCGIKEQIESSF